MDKYKSLDEPLMELKRMLASAHNNGEWIWHWLMCFSFLLCLVLATCLVSIKVAIVTILLPFRVAGSLWRKLWK